MRSLRGLPLGLIVAVAIGIATAVAVGTARPACACVAPPSSPVDGVVVEVNATGLTEIQDFTLRTAVGFNMTFQIGQLENPTEFAPGHLKEHQATGSPVRVYFNRSSTGQLMVYRMEDAPASSSSP
jgi:hypothetical protein